MSWLPGFNIDLRLVYRTSFIVAPSILLAVTIHHVNVPAA